MAKKLLMPIDANMHPFPALDLSASEDVDGTSASAQSAAIDAWMVRVQSLEAVNVVRVLVGANPTATDTDIALAPMKTLLLPIQPGQKVAIKAGKANICACGV